MARWAPDSEKRLRDAAIELYGERGFEATTVAEIAERAGLTERTFFRRFADKREVLFSGSEAMEEHIVAAVEGSDESLTALGAAAAGVAAIGDVLPTEPELSRRRQEIIDANPELKEREAIKFATLSRALAGALRERGVTEAEAALSAEVAIAVFKITFGRWIGPEENRPFAEISADAFAELGALTPSR